MGGIHLTSFPPKLHAYYASKQAYGRIIDFSLESGLLAQAELPELISGCLTTCQALF